MKTTRILLLSVIALFCAVHTPAQTADEIISKYLNAIGGKDKVSQITSIYMEGTMDVMGNQGILKTTLLNGKGFKQEMDFGGSAVIMCYTDSTGWQVNPMTGNNSAETMTEDQYKTGRDQIFIGGFLVHEYDANAFKAELAGKETVGNVSAYKVKVVSPENTESVFYIDPETYYLVRIIQKGDMMGQPMDIVMTFSDYQKADNGYAIPYTTETSFGDQFSLVSNITKVEINKAIDPAVFVKP